MVRFLPLRKQVQFLSLLLGAALANPMHAQTADELKLGYICNLCDPSNNFTWTAKLALDDRVKEINAKGGIQGVKVRVIPYDTKDVPSNVVVGARKLIEQDHVDCIIGIQSSAGASGLGTIAEAARVPIFATTASGPLVTQTKDGSIKPYMFRACFTDSCQAAILADFAFKDLGKRKAAFIFGNDYPYPATILRYFEAEFTRLGGQVVAKEGFSYGTEDFKPKLSSVAKAEPDCLVIATGEVKDVSRSVQQAESMGLKFQYLGPDGWAVNDLLSMAGKQLEGSFLTSGFNTEDPRFADFNAHFKQAHNLKCDVGAYYTLDAFMAMEYAAGASLKKTGKIDPMVMREALETMKDVPVFTGRLTMDPATHDPRDPHINIVTVKDGKWQTFKTYYPE